MIDEKIYFGFVECGVCAAKPGTPALCDSCLINRKAIGAANILLNERDREIAKINERIRRMRAVIEALLIL